MLAEKQRQEEEKKRQEEEKKRLLEEVLPSVSLSSFPFHFP